MVVESASVDGVGLGPMVFSWLVEPVSVFWLTERSLISLKGSAASSSWFSSAYGKLLWYSCLENPMNSMQRQKDRTQKEELPRSVGAPYATGDQ